MCNLYREPSIDASYQVSVHLPKGFQSRRLKCEKLMDDRRWMTSDGKSSHCIWQGELIKRSKSGLKRVVCCLERYNLVDNCICLFATYYL
jgi:hypothetical protein